METDFPDRLANDYVALEALHEGHREPLRALVDDPAIWQYFPLRGDGVYWDIMFDRRLAEHTNSHLRVFTVRDLTSNKLVGQTCFLNISPENSRLEIGGTWYIPAAQGSKVNPACKLLLLEAAFAAGAKRVEFKTDARNLAARQGILKLGTVEEGTLRAHMLMWDGHQRDTIYYSILQPEWPAVKAKLQERLAA